MTSLKEKVPIVIQATMISKVFPGKVLKRMNDGQTVIEFLVSRIRETGLDHQIILAISDLDEDIPLVREASRLGIMVVRGPQRDLLRRLILAGEVYKSKHIIRILGSNLLLDVEALRDLINAHFSEDWEYTYNDHLDGVMLGTGAELVSVELMKQLDREKLTLEQREVGILFIRQHGGKYKVNKFRTKGGVRWVNLSIDTPEDLERINELTQRVQPLTSQNITSYIEENPYYGRSFAIEQKEVGLEKLFIHPEKAQAVQASEQYKPDLSYPISVELSLTNRCNFDCVWCSDKDLRASMEDDISLDLLRKLFRDLRDHGTSGVVIEGGGEPTIYRDFDKVLDLLDEFGLGKGLITNGSLSLPTHRLERLDWIRVSLDSSTPQEHLEFKGVGSFEQVLANINLYARHCSLVGVGYVVTNKNLENIETLIFRLKEFGIKYIQFRPVVDHPDLAPSKDLSYLSRYNGPDFSIIIDGMLENVTTGNNGLPCKAHSLTSVVTADGSVYLCGRLNIYPWIRPVGNLHEQSFHDIWNGEERQRQHSMVMDEKFCQQHCPQCRLTKFNELFNRLDKVKTRRFI